MKFVREFVFINWRTQPATLIWFLHCKFAAQKLGQAFPIVSAVFANPRRKCFRFVDCRTAETWCAVVNQTWCWCDVPCLSKVGSDMGSLVLKSNFKTPAKSCNYFLSVNSDNWYTALRTLNLIPVWFIVAVQSIDFLLDSVEGLKGEATYVLSEVEARMSLPCLVERVCNILHVVCVFLQIDQVTGLLFTFCCRKSVWAVWNLSFC